jgi:hypothetical protein
MAAAALGACLLIANACAARQAEGDAASDMMGRLIQFGRTHYSTDQDLRDVSQCVGPTLPVRHMEGRVLLSAGDPEAYGGLSVSRNGRFTVSEKRTQKIYIFADGPDHAPISVKGSDSGLVIQDTWISADGHFAAWPDGLGDISIYDTAGRRRAPAPPLECLSMEAEWIGGDLLVRCAGGEATYQLLTRDETGFRIARTWVHDRKLDDVTQGRLAIAILDDSGQGFLRGEKVYSSLEAALADGASPEFPPYAEKRVFRVGARLVQISLDDPDVTPALVVRDAATGDGVDAPDGI